MKSTAIHPFSFREGGGGGKKWKLIKKKKKYTDRNNYFKNDLIN